MFILKKLISQFLYPLQFSTLLLGVGTLLLLFTRRQKLGKNCVVFGLITLLASSYAPLPSHFLYQLEHHYTPMLSADQSSLPAANRDALKWIVVLSGGHKIDPILPAIDQLTYGSLARTVEAIRLYAVFPQSKVFFSGGMISQGRSNGKVMAAAARELGLSQDAYVVGPLARDTREEAYYLQEELGTEPFILVTSASHMRRSVGLFHKLGMRPVPAPADYRTICPTCDTPFNHEPLVHPATFFPQTNSLDMARTVVHEYLGWWWAKLRGQI